MNATYKTQDGQFFGVVFHGSSDMDLRFEMSVTPAFTNAGVAVSDEPDELTLDTTTGVYTGDFFVNSVSVTHQ
jgi:hypothetical protein